MKDSVLVKVPGETRYCAAEIEKVRTPYLICETYVDKGCGFQTARVTNQITLFKPLKPQCLLHVLLDVTLNYSVLCARSSFM